MLREFELEMVKQQCLFLIRLSVTRHDQHSPIGGWKGNIQHLNSGQFIEHRSRRQSRCMLVQPVLQRHH